MNTENRVFNKLAQAEKVELSAQRVELSLMDDFIKQYNGANKLTTKAYGGTFKIDAALKSMLKDYDAAGKSFLKANARYQELENSAKKIGIDLDAKYENYKSDISKTLKEIDSASRKILQALKLDFV